MSNRSMPFRRSVRIALSVAALFATPLAASAEEAGVRVSPALEREWLLQVSPGSAVTRGYGQETREKRAEKPKARRAYPGYAEAQPGVRPGYSEMPEQRRTTGGLFGYFANRQRATINEPQQPSGQRIIVNPVKPQPVLRTTGLFRPARPAATASRTGFDPMFLPQEVSYPTSERAGTVVIDTNARFLYLVGEDGRARRYGVGVGKPGFEWAGRHQVTRKSEWPTWTPPSEMRARERQKGRILPVQMAGGPENPLGARAMYLGSTLYRIHGTNQPWSIGKAVSSGCIRMRNEDVMDLYERVPVGTRVIVL